MHSLVSQGWRASLWAYAPIFLWIGVIFFLSSPEGSFAQTSRIIGPLLQFFFPNLSEATLQIIHGYVRKTAHFTEYACLAFLAFRAFSTSAVVFIRKYRYLLPVLLVLLIASLDEFNQSFEPSRTASPLDVLLDLSGGTTMILLIWLIYRRRQKV